MGNGALSALRKWLHVCAVGRHHEHRQSSEDTFSAVHYTFPLFCIAPV